MSDTTDTREVTLPNELDFEQWYIENAFDFERNPIGSWECALQRKAWHGALERIRSGDSGMGDGWMYAPLEAGWHWHWDGEVFQMLFVQQRPGHAYLAVQEDDVSSRRHFRMTHKMGGHWYGPINPPRVLPPPPTTAASQGGEDVQS